MSEASGTEITGIGSFASVTSSVLVVVPKMAEGFSTESADCSGFWRCAVAAAAATGGCMIVQGWDHGGGEFGVI